jgi:hypothetical protein
MDMRLVQHIAERTARYIERAGLVTKEEQEAPTFYVWPREDRVVLAFDPLAGAKVDQVLTDKHTHRLSTLLSGRRVVATNTRGIFLQIAYIPAPVADLSPRPLDLAQQPGPLHVPVGMTARGPLWLSLPEMDAVLVGGTRRMGKTSILHAWIQALIRGGQSQLFLRDGKRGVEFMRYAGADGVTVATDAQGLGEMLAAVSQELARRERLFLEAGAASLPDYVERTGDRLSLLVLVVDEFASLEEEAQEVVKILVSTGGAFGVHPILATQSPRAEAVQSLTKTNLSTRIALPVPTYHDSMVILGQTGAEKMPNRKGRMLLTWDARLVEAQSFLVDLPDPEPAGAPLQPQMLSAAERRVAEAAIDELEGWFNIVRLTEITGESKDRINALARRWELMGFLTEVLRNEQGHLLGRKVTKSLVQQVRPYSEPIPA